VTVPRILIAIDLWDDEDVVELVDEHGPTAIAAWLAILCGAKRGAGQFGARWAVLARRIGVAKHDVKRVAEDMQRLGLITLEDDPDDGGAHVTIVNWERYQVDPTSTRRTREYRARKAAETTPTDPPDASVETRSASRHTTSHNVTQRNGNGEQNVRTTEGLRPSGAPAPRTRRKDDLWDALIDELDIDPASLTTTGRGAINKALSDLRHVNATPDQIRQRAATHRHRWPTITLTAPSLAKHWATLEERTHHPPTPTIDEDAVAAAIAQLERADRIVISDNGATG